MSVSFFNGNFVDTENILVSILDMGILRGYGVFEFVRTYSGIPFCLDDHLDRLKFSSDKVHLKLPYSKDEISSIVETLIKKNGGGEFYIRIVLTAGNARDHLLPGSNPTFAIIFDRAPLMSEKINSSISLYSIPFQRQFHDIKSLQYMGASLCFQKAVEMGFQDALYLDDFQNILESTTSNFFGVIGNTIVTPCDKVLPGITRKVVIELAKDAGLKVEMRQLSYDELKHFSEAFITSSIKEIMPVSKIDNFDFSIKGPVTTQLIALFTSLARKKVNLF